jgi:hypothetical protein
VSRETLRVPVKGVTNQQWDTCYMFKHTALALVFGVTSISAAVAAEDGITKTLENNTYQQTAAINCKTK